MARIKQMIQENTNKVDFEPKNVDFDPDFENVKSEETEMKVTTNSEIEKLKQEIFNLKNENQKLQSLISNDKSYDHIISSLQAQIAAITNKLSLTELQSLSSKVVYRPVKPEDWEEETAVFTANRFMFIIGGYEKNGVVYNPPHKLIKFMYAASDVRKDGREDQIKHYCQFETNLKTEKEFLRNHPLYNVVFFENLNQTMATDSKFMEYSALAANEVASLTDPEVLTKLHSLGIKGTNKYSINELRGILIKHLAEKYQALAKDQLVARTQRMIQNIIMANTTPEENDTGK